MTRQLDLVDTINNRSVNELLNSALFQAVNGTARDEEAADFAKIDMSILAI